MSLLWTPRQNYLCWSKVRFPECFSKGLTVWIVKSSVFPPQQNLILLPILCGAGQLVGLVLMVPVITSPSQQRIRHPKLLTATHSSSEAPHNQEFVITSPLQPRIRQHKPLTATNSSSQAPHSHEFVITSPIAAEFIITSPSPPRIRHHKPLTAMNSSSQTPHSHEFFTTSSPVHLGYLQRLLSLRSSEIPSKVIST
jgi:hypothetical protein